jgi:lauroyl/myristoyl acyltransferase
VQTGARYVWTASGVQAAREYLYRNLRLVMPDPHQAVVERIAQSMDKYIRAFHLFDANRLLELAP